MANGHPLLGVDDIIHRHGLPENETMDDSIDNVRVYCHTNCSGMPNAFLYDNSN